MPKPHLSDNVVATVMTILFIAAVAVLGGWGLSLAARFIAPFAR